VAGSINSFGAAVLWKNGTMQKLSEGNRRGMAFSVFVSGDDVYVAGTEFQPQGRKRAAVLWKNGMAQRLSKPSASFGTANSVYVADGDVYVVGFESRSGGSSPFSVLWKNGEAQYISNGVSDVARSVIDDTTSAHLWRNGRRIRINAGLTNAGAYSVFVVDGDNYVAGSSIKNGRTVATISKNGAERLISDGKHDVYVESIFVK
jgi:hypothetical protein